MTTPKILAMIYSKLLTTLYGLRFGPPVETPEAEAAALVLIADGVGGFELTSFGLRHVVGQGGGPELVRAVPWGHGWGRWHADLTNIPNQRAGARAVADRVLAWREAHPDRPAYLVGKSGGTGIAVGALELLPAGSVEAAFLLAAALSPTYDLTRALRAVGREIVAFWSPLDVIILGAGTWLFGTMDRVHSVGAGLVGFRPPDDLDAAGRALYAAKLRQVRWTPEMVASGHLGGHAGTDNPAFLRRYILPLLRAGAANPAPEPPRGSSPPPAASINPSVGATTPGPP